MTAIATDWKRRLRPVIAPIWRPIRRRLRPGAVPTTARRVDDRWTGPTPETVHRDAPIRAITGLEFEAVAGDEPTYYRGRRGYVSQAASVADGLIAARGLRTALELGPHRRSIVVGADVMDRHRPPGIVAEGSIVVHDARSLPWPFESGAYDLFVALQVFEHLRGHQATVFGEVRRVARNAIVSLPIDWEMPDPADVHHRLTHEAVLAWFAPVTPTRVIEGSPAPRKRLIYVFEGLSAE